jgi:hypothetical protein
MTKQKEQMYAFVCGKSRKLVSPSEKLHSSTYGQAAARSHRL